MTAPLRMDSPPLSRLLAAFSSRMAIGMAALGSALIAAPAAFADDYPSRPLRLIVPFPPGGAADVIGRIYADGLSKALRQAVVVHNKPGAGTAIAAEEAAGAAPDGYTLSLAPVGQLAILPHLNKQVRYQPLKDFAPISLVASVPYVIAASASQPASSLKDLIGAARAQPGKYSYSSCGSGTVCHLSGELFKNQTGADLLHVPYKGSAPAVTGLLAGDVQLAFDTLTVLAPHVRSGRIKALAVTSRERSALLPHVPTAIEAGLPNYEVTSWFGIVAPAATPRDILRKLNTELTRIAESREVREKFAAQGLDALASTPEQFAALIRDDYAKWGKVVVGSGATAD